MFEIPCIAVGFRDISISGIIEYPEMVLKKFGSVEATKMAKAKTICSFG
jgi:hypothetical protein